MSIIILSKRDDGEHIPAVELCERVLEVAPETTCRLVKGTLQGVEVDDGAALKYLKTLDTAAGRERKG